MRPATWTQERVEQGRALARSLATKAVASPPSAQVAPASGGGHYRARFQDLPQPSVAKHPTLLAGPMRLRPRRSMTGSPD
eukprot:12599521-Alexandrium_andersonii.AAC.1